MENDNKTAIDNTEELVRVTVQVQRKHVETIKLLSTVLKYPAENFSTANMNAVTKNRVFIEKLKEELK